MTAPARAESRDYVVGLPVVVSVSETGAVTYWIDTSEAGFALWDDEDAVKAYGEVRVEADQQAVDKDHYRRMREEPTGWPNN